MRFQKIEKEDIIYINDAYSASPISMEYSLNTFDKLYNNMKKDCGFRRYVRVRRKRDRVS